MEASPDYAHLSERLNQETRDLLFKEHSRNLFTQRLKAFRDLLDDSRHLITPLSRWDDVRKSLSELDDERFIGFPERNRQHTFQQHVEFLGKKVKREFAQYINDMGTQMLI
jgi:FF domain